MYKKILLALVLSPLASVAVADVEPSAEEAAKIEAALADWGCSGGEMAKEPDVDHYEVDDATCKEGEYDFKLDGDFNAILIHRH